MIDDLIECAKKGEKLDKVAHLMKTIVPELKHYALNDEQPLVQ
jgi:hypothetical protein